MEDTGYIDFWEYVMENEKPVCHHNQNEGVNSSAIISKPVLRNLLGVPLLGRVLSFILHIDTCAWYALIQNPCYFMSDPGLTNNRLFRKALVIDVTNIPNEMSQDFEDFFASAKKIEASISVGYVGKRSFSLETDIELEFQSGKKFKAHVQNAVVSVDITSRKSVALTDWFRDKAVTPYSDTYALTNLKLPDCNHPFTFEKLITSKHIDPINHVSYVVFIEIMLQGIRMAGQQGFLTKQVPSNEQIKKVVVVYEREVHLNDRLVIRVWEGEHYDSSERMFYTSVRNADSGQLMTSSSALYTSCTPRSNI